MTLIKETDRQVLLGRTKGRLPAPSMTYERLWKNIRTHNVNRWMLSPEHSLLCLLRRW
jgi:hypothetical protein